ncbi:MAG: orotate phosphoribosyltransferase [Porticoccaceae bacterium]
MSELKAFQSRFIDLAIEYDVLRFGEFTLKSGRKSPYFFNAGNFNSGKALSIMGACYADAIVDSGLEIDLLFGPAYKGIPLVAVTAAALADRHQIDLPYCFNRKEAKDHGEGGDMVGAELKGRALVVDDVITAGTAIREVIDLMEGTKASVGAVLIGLDRQERGAAGHKSAIGELNEMYDFPVISIIGLEHIRMYIAQLGDKELLQAIDNYREEYGAK